MPKKEKLDCGHYAKPKGKNDPGYAIREHDDGSEETACYECAFEWTKEDLRTLDKVDSLYLTKKSDNTYEVTTWNGITAATITNIHSQKVGYGGRRYYVKCTDVLGQAWHGTSPGPGMFVRLKKSKAKKRQPHYVVKKRGKWLAGHSYATGVGYKYKWTTDIEKARMFDDESIAHKFANMTEGKCEEVTT